MEDLRYTAYAYHKAAKEVKENDTDAAINAFFNEMDSNHDGKISFEEFKRYMKTVDHQEFSSDKDFFNKLKKNDNDYLIYGDIVTLLYIIISGRPFCENCKGFVEGTFFTCVQCFEKEKAYCYNFCPSCYYDGKNHTHCHKEFMDPTSLLLLKAKRESKKPISRVLSLKKSKNYSEKPSDSKTCLSSSSSSAQKDDESKPSISKAIDSVKRPKFEKKKPDRVLELMQFAAGCTTIAAAASQLCTIM